MFGYFFLLYFTTFFVRECPKKSKRDDEDLTSSIMALLATKLAEHKEVLLSEFKESYSKLETKLDNFQTTVNDHHERISKLEEFASSADGDLRDVLSKMAVLADNANLKARLADLEDRNRCNNVRIVGLPEDIEGPQPTAFFSQILLEVFGDNILTSPPELDRAHRRTLAVKPRHTQPPQAVVVCFH